MSLVTTKDMFEKSMKEHFAIGAFNVNNMEIIQGIVDAAAEENSPVILQASSSAIKYARIGFLRKMIEAALEENDIPIALHLDHGPDFETCKMCIDHGFSSVMIDGSKYDFEENVALTKKVVEYAHNRGVVVEAELGKLAGIEDEVNVAASDAMFTDPDQAKEFVERTGCDSLAIAIGTSHGAYKFKGEAKLRFDILKEIKALIPDVYIREERQYAPPANKGEKPREILTNSTTGEQILGNDLEEELSTDVETTFDINGNEIFVNFYYVILPSGEKMKTERYELAQSIDKDVLEIDGVKKILHQNDDGSYEWKTMNVVGDGLAQPNNTYTISVDIDEDTEDEDSEEKDIVG